MQRKLLASEHLESQTIVPITHRGALGVIKNQE